MALAGYCRVCGQYVWLNDQWGCVNGHGWNEISNWYDPQSGTPVTPYWLQQQAPAPAPVAPMPVAPVPTPVPVAPAPMPVAPAVPVAPAPAPAPMPATYAPTPIPPAPAPVAPAPVVPAPVAPAPVAPEALAPEAPTAPVAETAPEPELAAVAEPEPSPEPAPAPQPEAPAVEASAATAAVATTAAAGPSDRLAMLADMLATLGMYPNYKSQYGTDTDIVIDNQIVDASWGTGKMKVEFSAIMKAVEAERTIYYWEILKEKSSGLNFGGFESETTTTFGTKRSGTKSEFVMGPNGVAVDMNWDYGATRRIVEDVAARHGWAVKVVLKRSSASW